MTLSQEDGGRQQQQWYEKVLLSVVPILSLDTILCDERFSDLRAMVRRLSGAMTAREAAVINGQGGQTTERQSRDLAQRLRSIDESIVRLMEQYDAAAARDKERNATNAPGTTGACIREKKGWADIGPSSMDSVVQYPALHMALVEEHKTMELLLAQARSGVNLTI